MPLGRHDYSAVLRDMVDLGLSGGSVCDAPIARAAKKAAVDRLLTLEPGDFRRVRTDGERIIASP